MLKYLKGEKPLVEAFGLYVGLALASFALVWLLREQDVFSSFSSQLLATFLITVPVRLFAWTVVLRCAKNSDSGVFRFLARALVAIDILHKLFYWSVVSFSLAERDRKEAFHDTQFERCKLAIVDEYDEPIDNLHGDARLEFGSGDPAYKVLTYSRTRTYRCVIDESGAQLTDTEYVKWFRHRRDIDIAGTALLTEVELTPRYLGLSYGPPGPGGGNRVSGIYTFVSDAGEVFTVYDYKSTSLWDPQGGLPEPEVFWSSSDATTLSVGGHSGSDYLAFVQWLRDKDAYWKSRSR